MTLEHKNRNQPSTRPKTTQILFAVTSGKFRVIIPVRLGDFVPVWETEQEAVAVIAKFTASLAGAMFDFEAVEIGTSIQSGGPMKQNRGHFLGVDGFTVPEPPPRIDPVTGRPYR